MGRRRCHVVNCAAWATRREVWITDVHAIVVWLCGPHREEDR